MSTNGLSQESAAAEFHTLANLMPTLCWMANADGWIYWYNTRWYEYTGTTPREMEGWGWQSVHDPAVLPSVLKEWKASIQHGDPFEMTFPLRSAAGTFRPFLTRITPVRGADGAVVRWLGVNTDIGEERAALELREQFMAVLGHDLRNPLHAILSGLTLLRKTPLDGRAISVAGLMENSARRMEALIEDVLDMARSRLGGGLAINPDADKPLEPALREVIAELSVIHPERVVDAVFDCRKPIRCDRARIAQLFSNLLGNALTYGARDQPIRVRMRCDGHDLELSIANGGAAIPAEDLERLFQPFFRGATRPSREGLGLGLYIAHQIATAHGGTIEVTSTAAETSFTFRLQSAV